MKTIVVCFLGILFLSCGISDHQQGPLNLSSENGDWVEVPDPEIHPKPPPPPPLVTTKCEQAGGVLSNSICYSPFEECQVPLGSNGQEPYVFPETEKWVQKAEELGLTNCKSDLSARVCQNCCGHPSYPEKGNYMDKVKAFCTSDTIASLTILSLADDPNGKGDNSETGSPGELH